MIVEKNIAIFTHTLAGKGKSISLLHKIEVFLKNRKAKYNVFKEDCSSIINDHTEVWIVGGDGTLNYFLNKFPNINLPLVIFKGGTGNDFAWRLYGDISLDTQLNLVLTAQAKLVDAALCNDKIFINAVGFGFDGEIQHSMGVNRLFGGHLDYLWKVFKKIFTFKEYNFSINCDQHISNKKYLLVMITNAIRMGGGFHVSPLANITDGKLNLILCNPLPVLKRLKYLPYIETGKHLQLPFITHYLSNSFIINCEKPILAQLDGEIICDEKFEISVLPKKYFFKY